MIEALWSKLADTGRWVEGCADGLTQSRQCILGTLYPLTMNYETKYRVIHKSLWDFRTRLRNNQDRHGRKEHINR